MQTINKLIINSPYQEPAEHWHYERETREFDKKLGRRPAGYIVATPKSKGFDDPGVFVPIDLVNQIRPRIKSWRESGYPGVTGITKCLLEHWQNPEIREGRRFFFCQLEAIETLIWLTEAPAADKTGINIIGDGGAFERWCSKMATGTGKTIIMSMILAWQFLNKVTYPNDTRFSKHALVIAPNLTVKNRLNVLNPADAENYFVQFHIVPMDLMDKLRLGKLIIHNWHTLNWDTQDKIDSKVAKGQLRSVDKRQRMELSGTAYAKKILGEMANAKNIIVINDEAHHAWRVPAESKIKGIKKEDIEESTIWVGGLDRIHQSNGILRCFDLSATPYAPSGKKANEEALFSWIVSDFGLNDAIESGLVKTPRVVVKDNSRRTQELTSRLYHIYMDDEVNDDINRSAEASEPLPDLLRNAYDLLGIDWLDTKKRWEEDGHPVPPVMITVANRTETSARIKYAFEHQQINIKELCNPDKLLQIDSKVLESAEAGSEAESLDIEVKDETESEPVSPKLTKKQQAEMLRLSVDTIGKAGHPGANVHNVLSVGMLTEGWDAKTVTHIMGLRAFSSQLLCEQVIGRGLRRISYDVSDDGLLEAEYVNIFGVPFTFLPHEGGDVKPKPTMPKTKIEPLAEKQEHEIKFPNIIRIDTVYKPRLVLDWNKVKTLEIDPYDGITKADLAAIVAGKPNAKVQAAIYIEKITEETRLQTIIFKMATTIFKTEKGKGLQKSNQLFLAQLVRLVGEFIESDKIHIKYTDEDNATQRKVLIMLNMSRIIQHIWNQIRTENSERLTPIFDREHPIRSTADVWTWYTSKPCEWLKKSHISHCVYDSAWEACEAYYLDNCGQVRSFVKNDHLGFAIFYNYKGIIRKYYPDFIVRLKKDDFRENDEYLILEVKGQDTDQDKTKREFLAAWVKAVNEHGGFGRWHWAVSFEPSDLPSVIKKIQAESPTLHVIN